MTVTTRVALTGPIDADTAFVLALRAILTAGGQQDRFDSARSRTATVSDVTVLATVRGQGLPAITEAEANADGTQLDLPTHLEDTLPGWTLREQTCSALITWDTGVFYDGPIWGDVDHLHAAAIVLLCDNLPDDVDLHWRHEATGAWHHRWTGLNELTGSDQSSDDIVTLIRNTHGSEPQK